MPEHRVSIRNAVLPAGPWSDLPHTQHVHIDIDGTSIGAVHAGTGPGGGAGDGAGDGAGGGLTIVDVEGACVLPGLVDTHTHLGWAAEDYWSVSWAGVTTRGEALKRLTAVLPRIDDGFWALGGDWLPSALPDRELPDRAQLDQATGARPLLLTSRDRSVAVLNSRALELCRIDRTTADPAGGRIGRDHSGEPTGDVYGEAVWGRLAVGAVPPRNRHRRLAEMRSLLADLVRRGITEVHDIGTYPRENSPALINTERSFTDLTLLEELAEHGELPVRAGYRPSLWRVADFARTATSPQPSGNLISFAGFKMSLDNGWFSEPPGPRIDSFRYPGYGPALALMRRADELSAPVSIHAIGDLGVGEALDLIGSLPVRRGTKRPPHRIIHARRIRPEDVRRCAELGVAVEVQPWEIVGAGRVLTGQAGPDFAAMLSPYRSLLDAGVTVAFGSDRRLGMRTDLADCDPLLAIQIAVTRTDPTWAGEPPFQEHQRLTVTEALHCAAGAGAAAIGASGRRGRVAAGYDADLVILSGDPLQTEPEKIGGLRVECIVSAGRLYWPTRRPA